MKKFIFSILCVSVFFAGLGALVQKAGASFKSDEKALELIRKARQAIGGDNAIAGVKSLRIVGQTTRTFKINGVDRSETGETEIAMQLPDKIMKMVKIGHDDGTGSGETSMMKRIDVEVVGGDKDQMKVTVNGAGSGSGAGTGGSHKIIIKKDDGTVQELTGAEAEKVIADDGGQGGENVMKIIIKKPDGTVQEVTGPEADKIIVPKGAGDTAVFTTKTGSAGTTGDQQVIIRRMGGDGPAAEAHHDAMRHNEMLRLTLGLLLSAPEGMDVSYTFGGEGDVDGTACNVVVAGLGESSFKIYLSKSTNLPVMMSYKGIQMPTVVRFRTAEPTGKNETKENVFFTRRDDGPAPEMAEFNVKFSDYRSVGGVQLPYKWAQTVGGAADETFDVSSYEINPANIDEKFQNQNVIVRMKKPDGQ
jgi:hypothetical protein